MIDKDILLAKVANIQNCLKRISQVHDNAIYLKLDEFTVHDVIVLNLQRAVQATIDMAAHVVAAENYGLPQSQKDLFTILENEHILDHHIAQTMKNMVGFHNIAVHEYSFIDPHILQSILDKHLGDLEKFYSILLRHYHVAK